MHSANSYLSSIGKLSPGLILAASERQALSQRLLEDSRDYYHSALVSLVDGLISISDGFPSWATVKLYYSVFYALRARLALNGDCIFYEGTKPRHVNVSPGASVATLKGTTHKCVLTKFSALNTFDFFLSQEIASERPLDWLEARREQVNYKTPRFSEPDFPDYFLYASRTDLRQMLNSYLADDVYIHDPDHAIVAFPFRLLVDLSSRMKAKGIEPLDQGEMDFIREKLRDRSGALASVTSLLI